MTNKKINNNIEQESGRSMVEMLGVLAIIGVLSVGGISGYTTAMNKHKANEILNAAAVRAMAVSSQLQNGATTPTLDEFPKNEVVGGATFGGVETIGDKFTIALSNLDLKVKAQMENIIGDGSIVRKITDGGLTYNDDLSTEVRASDFDGKGTGADACDTTQYTYCSGSGKCLEGTNADCSQTCVKTSPECQECNATTGVLESANEGEDCTTSDNKSGTCNSGACEVEAISCAQCPGTCPSECYKVDAPTPFYAFSLDDATSGCQQQVNPSTGTHFAGAIVVSTCDTVGSQSQGACLAATGKWRCTD